MTGTFLEKKTIRMNTQWPTGLLAGMIVMLSVNSSVLGPTRLCAEEADNAGAAKINYEEHIKPIFREHCLKCHNGSMKKGGLALDTYGATMEGGASGEVVFAEDLESSRLWALVTHEETPVMPPNGGRIADEKLARIQTWIEQGALETSGSKKVAVKKPDWSFQPTAADDGPGAMPEGWLCRPVTTSSRPPQIASLACSPRSPLVAVSGYRQVSLYHAQSGELLGVAPFPEGTPYIIRFSRDGSLMMVGGGRAAHSGYVALYDVRSGRRVARVGDELDAVMTADIDASLRSIAIGDSSKLVKLFDIGSEQPRTVIKKHTDWVTAVAFSPDGKWLASADRAGGLVLWEAATGREYMVYVGHAKSITAISWRGDSAVFATSSEDGNVRIWSRDGNRAIRNWSAHGPGVSWVAFAKDGNVATIGRDGRARFWDGNGKGLQTFAPLADIGLRVAIGPDSKRVFVGDWTGAVKYAQVDKPDFLGTLYANPRSLDDQLASAKTALEEKTRLWEQATAKKHTADTQRVELAAQRDQASQKLAQVEDRVRQLQAEAAALREQLKTVEQQTQKEQQQVEPAKVAVNNMVNAVKSAEQTVQAAQVQAQSVAEVRDAQRRIVERLQASQNAFAQRATELKSAIETRQKRIAEVQAQLQTHQDELAAVTKKITDAGETPNAEDTTRKGELQARIKELQQQLESARQALAAAESDHAFFQQAYGTE